MSIGYAIIILGCQLCATWVFTVWMRLNRKDRSKLLRAQLDTAMEAIGEYHKREMLDQQARIVTSALLRKQQSRGGN